MSSVETVGKDGHELKLDGLNFALLAKITKTLLWLVLLDKFHLFCFLFITVQKHFVYG